MKPIQIITNREPTQDISFSVFFDRFKDEFFGTPNTQANVNEMESYLNYNLHDMYPKLSISLKITINSDNSIYVQFYNDFYEELKRYYPEAMF